MSINNHLPFCDTCGYPYKDGLPTCDCESRLAQEDQDDRAVEAQIDRLKAAFKTIDRSPRGTDEEYAQTIKEEYCHFKGR